MNHSTIAHAAASGVAVLLMSACAAGVGIGAEPLEAKASTPASDTPACGYDVHRSKVYVTSLGKAHGTARVIKWSKPYGYDGKPHGIGTLVDSKPIRQGQTITINRPKHTKANR